MLVKAQQEAETKNWWWDQRLKTTYPRGLLEREVEGGVLLEAGHQEAVEGDGGGHGEARPKAAAERCVPLQLGEITIASRCYSSEYIPVSSTILFQYLISLWIVCWLNVTAKKYKKFKSMLMYVQQWSDYNTILHELL